MYFPHITYIGWGYTAYAETLEPLMIEYDVDIVFSGHVHSYERVHPSEKEKVACYPVRKERVKDLEHGVQMGNVVEYSDTYIGCDNKGPVYVIQGNSGGAQGEKWQEPKPDWSAVRFANGYIPPSHSLHEERERKKEKDTLSDSHTECDWSYEDTFGFGVVVAHNSTHLEYFMDPIEEDEDDCRGRGNQHVGYDQFWIIKTHQKD
jgi:hypothetical protein